MHDSPPCFSLDSIESITPSNLEIQLSENESTRCANLLDALASKRLQWSEQFKRWLPLHLHLELSSQMLDGLSKYLKETTKSNLCTECTLNAGKQLILEDQFPSIVLKLAEQGVKKLYLEGEPFKNEAFLTQPITEQLSHSIEILLPKPLQSSQHQKKLDQWAWNQCYKISLESASSLASISSQPTTEAPVVSSWIIPERKKITLSTSVTHGVQLQNQCNTSLSYAVDIQETKCFSSKLQGNTAPLTWEALYQKWNEQKLNLPEAVYLTNLTHETWNNWLGHLSGQFQNSITHLTQRAFEQLVQFQKQFQFGLSFGKHLPPGYYVIQEGPHANSALDYDPEKALHDTIKPDPVAVQYYTSANCLVSPNTIDTWIKCEKNASGAAEEFARNLWSQLNQSSEYNREDVLLFREILPTLLYLSDKSIAQLQILVPSKNIEDLAFLLKHWPDLKNYNSEKELLPVAKSLLSSRYGVDKLHSILTFVQSVHENTQRISENESALLYQVLDQKSLNKLQEFLNTKKGTAFRLSAQNLNAILAVYESKGSNGVQQLVQLWELLDKKKSYRHEHGNTLLDVFHTHCFSKMKSYLPLLTEEYQTAFNIIDSFYQNDTQAQWWETLFIAHTQAVGSDHLPHMVSAFQHFLNKIQELGLKAHPLSPDQESKLRSIRNLPITLARILQLLNRCNPKHRITQWACIPDLDLSSQGAILITSDKILDDYQFALPEMRLTPIHWNLNTSLHKIRSKLITETLKSLEGEELLQAHYRLIACSDWSLSADFYKKITNDVINKTELNPTVRRFLLLLLRATTLGQHLAPALSCHKEEALSKEFDAFLKQASDFNTLCAAILKEKSLEHIIHHVLDTCSAFELHNAAPPLSFSTHINLNPEKLVKQFLEKQSKTNLNPASKNNTHSSFFSNIRKNMQGAAVSCGLGVANMVLKNETATSLVISSAIKLLKDSKQIIDEIEKDSTRFRNAAIHFGEKLYEGIRFVSENKNTPDSDHDRYLNCVKRMETIRDQIIKYKLDSDIKSFMENFIALVSTFELQDKDFEAICASFNNYSQVNQNEINKNLYYPLLIQTTDYLRKFSSNNTIDNSIETTDNSIPKPTRSLNAEDLKKFLLDLYPYLLDLCKDTTTDQLPNLKSKLLEHVINQFPKNHSEEVKEQLRRDLIPKVLINDIKNAFPRSEYYTAIQNCLSHFSDTHETSKTLEYLSTIETRLNTTIFQSFLTKISNDALYKPSPNLNSFNQLLYTLSRRNTLSALMCLIEHALLLEKIDPLQSHHWIEKACVYQQWVLNQLDTGLKALCTEEYLSLLSQIMLSLSLTDIQRITDKAHLENNTFKRFIHTVDKLIAKYPIAKPLILSLWKHYFEQYHLKTKQALTPSELEQSVHALSLSIKSLNNEQDVLTLLTAFQPHSEHSFHTDSDRTPLDLFSLLKSLIPENMLKVQYTAPISEENSEIVPENTALTSQNQTTHSIEIKTSCADQPVESQSNWDLHNLGKKLGEKIYEIKSEAPQMLSTIWTNVKIFVNSTAEILENTISSEKNAEASESFDSTELSQKAILPELSTPTIAPAITPLQKAAIAHTEPNNEMNAPQRPSNKLNTLLPVLIRTLAHGEPLHRFEALQSAYETRKISETVLKDYYRVPPYPSLSHVLAWCQLTEAEANAQYHAFSLEPQLRNSQNGFDLNFSKTQAQKFKGTQFSENELKDLSDQCQLVKNKTPEALLDALKEIQEKSEESKSTALIALVAELLYRSNSFKHAYEINTTQYLALLAILKGESSILLQMPTGEGKSRVMMLACALQYLLGHTLIDFVTSDLDLAQRDFNEYRCFFESLNIPINLIMAQSPSSAYQHNGINFSTTADLSLFRNARILEPEFSPNKKHSATLLIDEVDHCLDLYNTRFNCSQPSKDWQGLEWIYSDVIYFLETAQGKQWIAQPEMHWEKTYHAFLNSIIQSRKNKIEVTTLNQKREALARILEAALSAHLLTFKTQFTIEQSVPVLTDKGIQYSTVARVVKNNHLEKGSHYSNGVHECLHALLEMWRQKVHILTTKPDGLSQELFTLLKTCEYPFVAQPEPEIVSSSTSKEFLDYYSKIIGMTATAGNSHEQAEFQQYGLFTTEVPPHRPSRRVDQPPRLTSNRNAQIHALLEYIQEAQMRNQPVLLIARDDNDSQELMDEMIRKCKNNPSISTQYFQRLDANTDTATAAAMIQKAGHAGVITFGTNRISRGTHIPLSKEAKRLLVLKTHLSGLRDDCQALGRAGRQGDLGETRYVLNCAELPSQLSSKLFLAPEKYLTKLQIQMDDASQAHRLTTQIADILFSQAWKTKLCKKSQWDAIEWNQFYQPLLDKFNTLNLTVKLQEAKSVEEQTQLLQPYLCSFGLENNTEACSKINQTLQILPQVQSISVEFIDQKSIVFNRYDTALDGRAKTFNGLFMETRASLGGKRNWFANTKAWLKGHGILFADTRAVLNGERIPFANTITTIKSITVVCTFINAITAIFTFISQKFLKEVPKNTGNKEFQANMEIDSPHTFSLVA